MLFGIMLLRPRERFPGGNSVIGRCFLLDLRAKGNSRKAANRCTFAPVDTGFELSAVQRASNVIAVIDCNRVRVVPPKIICHSQECV